MPFKPLLLFFFIIGLEPVHAQNIPQNQVEAKEHMPPGTVPEKAWWNLIQYEISICPDYLRRYIAGSNEISFEVVQNGKTFQVDLQNPMKVTKVIWNDILLTYTRREDVYFIEFPETIKKGEKHSILVYFEGQPKEAKNPPFDNGWIWALDEKGRPWMSIA